MKILFLTLAIFLVLASAQDCNNPLLDVYGIPGETNPVPAGNVTFCTELSDGDTCCSNDTLTAIQANIIAATNELNNVAAQRDSYLVNLYFNYSDAYTLLVSQLQAFTADITNIQQNSPEIGNPLQEQITLYETIGNGLITDDAVFAANFVEFQRARTACWTTLLQIQGSAFCLACNPNYERLGVDPDGTINPGPGVCNAIQATCAPYLSQSLQFNSLIQASQTYERANDTLTWLNAYRNNGNLLPENVVIDTPIPPITNTTERTVISPQGCTETSCPWQCDNLFSPQFVVNATLAANGAGIIGGADIPQLPPIGVVIIPVEETEVIETIVEELVEEFPSEEFLAPIEEIVAAVEEIVQPIEEIVQAAEEALSNIEEVVTEIIVAAEEAVESISEITESRLLDEVPWGRLLQEPTWNPTLNETGFETPVDTDPGNVSNADEGGTPQINQPGGGSDALIVKATGAIILIVATMLI